LSARHYVYVWADGVYLQARMEPQAECMLVLMGGSRQISLIGFPREKYAQRILAIVSTTNIPILASQNQEATVDPQPRGPDWMQITPKAGSLFHEK
jgi:hypothetical protein